MKAKDAMEKMEAIADLADDLVSRNKQLKTALEACKALQGRILAADALAEGVANFFRVAAEYDHSWSARQFLEDEPAVSDLWRALSTWRSPDGSKGQAFPTGPALIDSHSVEVRGQIEALTRRNLELEAELAEFASTLSAALRRLQALDAEHQALLADIEAGEETDAGAFSVPIAREFTSQTRLTDFPWFRAMEAREEQVEILPEEATL